MITESEVGFIKDLLVELRSLADEPSDYLADEVDQAIEILGSLHLYDTQQVVDIIEGNTSMNDLELMDFAEKLVEGYNVETKLFSDEAIAFADANVPSTDDLAAIKVLADEIISNRTSEVVCEAEAPTEAV